MKTIDWMDLPEVALETIDEVERDGQPILVTRNGKGIVRMNQSMRQRWHFFKGGT